MSYLRHLYLSMFVYSGVQHIVCCVYLFFFVFCTLCCQFLWIGPCLIALSVFSNVYLYNTDYMYVFYGMVWFYSNYIYILYLNQNIIIKSQKSVQKFETPFARCCWKSGSYIRLSKDIRSQASSLDNHIPTIKQCLSKFKSNESKGYTLCWFWQTRNYERVTFSLNRYIYSF
jgi:hypothetical protein